MSVERCVKVDRRKTVSMCPRRRRRPSTVEIHIRLDSSPAARAESRPQTIASLDIAGGPIVVERAWRRRLHCRGHRSDHDRLIRTGAASTSSSFPRDTPPRAGLRPGVVLPHNGVTTKAAGARRKNGRRPEENGSDVPGLHRRYRRSCRSLEHRHDRRAAIASRNSKRHRVSTSRTGRGAPPRDETAVRGGGDADLDLAAVSAVRGGRKIQTFLPLPPSTAHV